MDSLLQDLRFALRALRRTPAFTAAAVLTLALGIGATTTIFSVFHAILLRRLPYERPDDLVMVWETIRRESVERRSVSYPNFEDWRRQSGTFDAIAAVTTQGLTATGGQEAERLNAELVSAGYWSLLGVRPLAGRAFTPQEDSPGAAPVALISHALWQRRFGGDAAVVGQTIPLNGQPTTIVGVAPAWFRGLSDNADLWVPFANPPGMPGYADELRERGDRWHEVVARLAPRTTLARAQTEMDAIARRLETQYPEHNANRGVEVVPLREELFGDLRRGLLVLLGAVGLVLLIACVNVANLLLVRAAGREREMAIRAALGASRLRTARQLLVESLVLALAGGAAGALLAAWGVELLARANPIDLPSFVRLRVDATALAAALLVSLATGVLFGLAPALAAAEPRLHEGLRAGLRGATTARGGRRLRSALVAAELGLAVILLVGAGLMLRSLHELQRFDPGFRADELLTMRLALPEQEYDPARAVALGRRLVEQVEAIPGVRSAALGSGTPLDGSSSAILLALEGRSDATQDGRIRVYRHRAGPGYFQTLGAPLVRGRDFTAQDADTSQATGVAIISQGMANRFWPGGDPVGSWLVLGGRMRMQVVGVVGDVKHRTLLEAATADPDVYFPLLQFPTRSLALLVRAGARPEGVIAAVRREVQALDPNIPVHTIATMRERLRGATAPARFNALLLGGFAALALLLAAVGVYGVMAYAVAQRRRELGIRIALGAQRGDVLRMVVGQGARLALLGVTLGVAGALAATRVLAGLLVGVPPTDVLTFVATAGTLTGVALLASYLPARRAARVDPVVALQEE